MGIVRCLKKKKIAVVTVALSVGIESSSSWRSVVQWVGSSLTYVEYQRSIPTEGKFLGYYQIEIMLSFLLHIIVALFEAIWGDVCIIATVIIIIIKSSSSYILFRVLGKHCNS